MDQHVAVIGAIVLALIILSGCFELFVLKQRALGRTTFFWGLTVLSLWVGVPFTRSRIVAATAVFLIGLVLIAIFSKAAKRPDEHG
jgi:hypothetical protein